MSRVVVVGSVNLDLTVAVSHLPATGETVLGSDVAFRPGGKGANQAVAAHRLGADAALVAAVGADRFGDDVRASLAAAGLPLDSVVTVEGATTGVAMITVAGDGENTVVVAPGANALLDRGQLAPLPGLINRDTVLALQLEIPLATCLEAAQLARRAGATVVLNAAPLPKLPAPTFTALLSTVDVLVVNECEALGLDAARAVPPAPPNDLDEWLAAAQELRRLGPATCVITLGPHGAVVAGEDGGLRQPAFGVTAVDSTGAGDSFCGALAVALAEHRPVAEAVRRGCAAGALATTRLGAQSAMPTTAELDAFLRANGRP